MGSKIIIKWGWVAEASSFVWLIFASSPTESNLVPISIYIYIYPLTFIISDLGRVIHLRRKSEREYGQFRVLMETGGSPEAPEREDLGHGGARRMGRGQSRSVQLHPRRRHSHHGFPQEGLFLLHPIPLFIVCFFTNLFLSPRVSPIWMLFVIRLLVSWFLTQDLLIVFLDSLVHVKVRMLGLAELHGWLNLC